MLANIISTHTPLAGRDGRPLFTLTYSVVFLLTRPSRGATCCCMLSSRFIRISTHTPLAGRDHRDHRTCITIHDFYSHAPRGARLPGILSQLRTVNFYSHAPRGARQDFRVRNGAFNKFLLTRPSRGATIFPLTDSNQASISTHTPLAGRDSNRPGRSPFCRHFYSHAPRGARPPFREEASTWELFLLTRPSRGATLAVAAVIGPCGISTHTPLAGRDISPRTTMRLPL